MRLIAKTQQLKAKNDKSDREVERSIVKVRSLIKKTTIGQRIKKIKFYTKNNNKKIEGPNKNTRVDDLHL